jgi:hypothetical protein
MYGKGERCGEVEGVNTGSMPPLCISREGQRVVGKGWGGRRGRGEVLSFRILTGNGGSVPIGNALALVTASATTMLNTH